MAVRWLITVSTTAVLIGAPTTLQAQDSKDWSPPRLADGQPDIQGMWNNVNALKIPMELPDGFSGPDFTSEDLAAIAAARAADAERRAAQPRAPSVGAYGAYWFDSYWNESQADPAPARIVEPLNGQIPDWTTAAHKTLRENRDHLHDSYAFMESADRCITRGVIGMMMSGVYNNGKLILQPPGYVVIQSEMVHRVRVIPIDGRPHVDDGVQLWEGDPRGHWEGNTLVVESTNFRNVRSMRGASAGIRSRQTVEQRLVERFHFAGPDTIRYSIHVDDPGTYTGEWTANFPLDRDPDYEQFEYACHEGNYSVPNALSGARFEERADQD